MFLVFHRKVTSGSLQAPVGSWPAAAGGPFFWKGVAWEAGLGMVALTYRKHPSCADLAKTPYSGRHLGGGAQLLRALAAH